MSTFIWVSHILLIASIAKLTIVSSEDPHENHRLSDKVSNLPGQNFPVNFEHYSGHVTVNEESGRSLFYWFFEADEDPSSKPLLLWLNGGPGCSSIGYGLAEELGPFHVEEDGKTLYLNSHSWNKATNLLFLDSPVGVGYSYSNTSSDLLTNGDKRTASDSLEFLLRWLERFPQYKGRDFYISGESYAGHYVPQLSQAIVRHNQKNGEDAINLKGFMVGNALTDDFHDHLGLFQFMWSVGMISDQTFKLLNLVCDCESFIHTSEKCEKALEKAKEELGDIDPYSIFTPPCKASSSSFNHSRTRKSKVGLLRRAYDPCTEQYTTVYFNLPKVQQALHVHSKSSPVKWESCNGEVNENWNDSPSSVLDIYRELLNSGLRIWIYSGNTDAVIPVTSTRYSIDALKLSTASAWRPWYQEHQVGGWTQEYEGLTFVTVRGAGHEVPLHKPKRALTLIRSFLSGNSMPKLELASDL